ncbi:hypothetical protein [Pedobacter sp. MC2016-24]|uniref:hypothetical protein n=1 Tax=Pedobacter sp. MC2016-24 TaxID=2780090 RepID=UPI001880527E|nr:hypothetical protein [Pedobacter sp. MC2016-24]MBE9599540.1 hypothetical protein [Pedobacter sp. MC2016-24]
MSNNSISKLDYLNQLIRTKATGSPERLAKKMAVCKRSVFSYLDILRELGAKIAYDQYKKTYYYEEAGTFNFKFQKES